MEAARFEQQDRADGLLTQWVAKSLCSISILQDPDFTPYVEYVSRTPCLFSAPSRQRVEAQIENKVSRLRSTVKNKISKDCEFFSASSEIWPTAS
ncbi:hypothetical protein V7S43_015912 [Phytophthora oleae]|uniref:Uncharacterized protein n=1 Tax=Phytophthora oleae TaxID=2107226 RepID=A0ABD3F1M4_9STRA